MSIYFILMFVGLGILIGSMLEGSAPAIIPMASVVLMIFGGVAGAALIISEGSHSAAIVSGLLLTALISFGLTRLLTMLFDAHDTSLAVVGRPAMSKSGVIVEAVGPKKAGVIKLDEAIEAGQEFPALARDKRSIPVGSRVVVFDLRRKALIVF